MATLVLRAGLGRVGLLDDLLEPLEELILGALEAIGQAREKTHAAMISAAAPLTTASCGPRDCDPGCAAAGAGARARRTGSAARLAAARHRASCASGLSASLSAAAASARPAPPCGVRTPSITACICCGDRQLDAVAGAELERGLGRAHALRRPCAARAACRRASGRGRARCRPGGCGCDARCRSAPRSPSPLRPASVSRPAAHRGRQPRDLDQAAGDERGHRVVAEAEALDDAGGDRHHVLQRAADLDAGDVVGRIQPQRRTAELLLDERVPPRRTTTRRRPPSAARPRPRPRTSARTARRPAAPARPRRRSPATSRNSVPCSSPLAALTNGTAAGAIADGAMHDGTQALRRHRDDHQRARRRRRPRSRRSDATPSTRATPGR